ncbi:MAG: hypothetical protein IT326_09890 [Anaerolineae bacterium]|nr:hypothetical protein [Anaerolineae bacterium]
MLDFVVYGIIIIDDIRLADGTLVHSVLGGGGPQCAFGARLWSRSVGLLSRIGHDMEAEHLQTLHSLGFDTSGVVRYDDLPTPHTVMAYDGNEYTVGWGTTNKWGDLLARRLTLPEDYRQPRVLHVLTGSVDDAIIETALTLRQQGTLFSLEPIISQYKFRNEAGMRELFQQVDVVSPDWPSASGLAHSDDPATVVRYLADMGPGMVAVRHGAHGSYTWDSTHDEVWHIPAYPVTVADPTGAGNAYSGGQSAGWGLHGDAKLAGCCAGAAASFLVERIGFPVMSEALEAEAQQRLEWLLGASRRL